MKAGNRVPSPTVQGWRGQLQSAQGVRGDPGQGTPSQAHSNREGALSVRSSHDCCLPSELQEQWGRVTSTDRTCQCREPEEPALGATQQRGSAMGQAGVLLLA